MKRILLLSTLALSVFVSALLVGSEERERRHFPSTEVFINNHKWGKNNGCSDVLAMRGRTVCGIKGASSEITWWCIGTNGVGDMYIISRKYPLGEPGAKTTSTNIVYTGTEKVVWKDDVQQLILRPKKVEGYTPGAPAQDNK
jgi:hypothetical protein